MSKTADNFEHLTEQDLEALRELYHGGHVSAEDCEQFRMWAADGERPESIAERPTVAVAVETVRYHVIGNCAHDIDHPPVRRSGYRVTERKCAQFREWAVEGQVAKDIAAREDVCVAPKTVGRHLRGVCPHDEAQIDYPPLRYERAFDNQGRWVVDTEVADGE